MADKVTHLVIDRERKRVVGTIDVLDEEESRRLRDARPAAAKAALPGLLYLDACCCGLIATVNLLDAMDPGAERDAVLGAVYRLQRVFHDRRTAAGPPPFNDQARAHAFALMTRAI